MDTGSHMGRHCDTWYQELIRLQILGTSLQKRIKSKQSGVGSRKVKNLLELRERLPCISGIYGISACLGSVRERERGKLR